MPPRSTDYHNHNNNNNNIGTERNKMGNDISSGGVPPHTYMQMYEEGEPAYYNTMTRMNNNQITKKEKKHFEGKINIQFH